MSHTILSEPAEIPETTNPRRSALLGQRKSTRTTPEKPVTFTRKPKDDAAAEAEPQPQPAPKRRSRKASAARPAEPDWRVLAERLEQLQQDLSQRPTWDDLRALEQRLRSPEEQEQLPRLQALLLNREEELEEMAALVEDFETQTGERDRRIAELESRCEEEKITRGELEKLLNSARRKLRQEEQQRQRASERLNQAEAFLREALLALLSPGDEFQEDLVEQIQTFLDLS